MQLRGKLVNFLITLEKVKENPESVKIDNIFLKTNLFNSLKKLLRCVILVDDNRSLQLN